jgi:[ribosomal protein S18]-alanine N-acetyltransferase
MEKDIAKISKIGQECFPDSDVSEHKTRERIFRGHKFIVAEISQETVGFLDYTLKPTSIRVMGLATKKSERGKGVGSELLAKAIHIAKKKGKLFVELRVAARNIRALNLYKKLGFLVAGRKARRDGRAVYRMIRAFET